MRIVYGEDQQLLRDEVRRFLEERVPVAEVRRLWDDPRGDDPGLWKELAELGWLGLRVDEAQGGAGLGLVDFAVVAEECGRRLLPSPLLANSLAARAIASTGDAAARDRWLPAIARGETPATVAHCESGGRWKPSSTTVRFEDGAVHGEKLHVWAGATADLLVVPVQAAAGLRTAVVEAGPGVSARPEVGLDPTRRQARVRFEAAPAVLLDGDLERSSWLSEAWVSIAAELAGTADALLGMAADYAATRVQFGRAIGSFQGIKHPLVDVLVAVEHARSLVYVAAQALDDGDDDAERLARMAKVAASDAAVEAARQAVQTFGGYGYTAECDAHLYLRRARCGRPAFGDPAHHRAWIAADLINGD